MDSRRSDEACPALNFDLLKVWSRDAFCCEVGSTDPPGCPWQSLALALQHARLERLRDAAALKASGLVVEQEPRLAPSEQLLLDEAPSEQQLRRRLVEAYGATQGPALRRLVETKRADPLSYFYFMRSTDAARLQWPWYLYCLTFASSDLAGGGVEAGVVNMPLDAIDVQVLADVLCTQITVRHFLEPAWRCLPSEERLQGLGLSRPRQRAHVVCHRGRWAPLLGPLKPEHEPQRLQDTIVELDLSKHGTMAALSGKTVLIKGYDSEAQCYRACAESLVLTVERSQIARVLFDERDVGSGVQWRFRIEDTTRPRRRGPPNSRMAEQAISGPTRGEAEPFHGIPDGSLEFQVLGELVRIHTRRRLGATKEELSGRVQLSGGEAPPPGSE